MVERYDWIPDEELLTVLYALTVSIFAIGGMTGALLVGRLVTTYGRLVCVGDFGVYNTLSMYSRPIFGLSLFNVSTQEGDAGESHSAGVHRRSSYGLQQEVQDACDGHPWTLHHRSTLG